MLERIVSHLKNMRQLPLNRLTSEFYLKDAQQKYLPKNQRGKNFNEHLSSMLSSTPTAILDLVVKRKL